MVFRANETFQIQTETKDKLIKSQSNFSNIDKTIKNEINSKNIFDQAIDENYTKEWNNIFLCLNNIN